MSSDEALEKRVKLAAVIENLSDAIIQHEWHPAHVTKLEQVLELLGEIKLTTSTRKLLILDLNGVLMDREFDKEGKIEIDPDQDMHRVGSFVVWRRPGLDAVLPDLFRQYDVAVWSSVKKWNADQLIPLLFGEYAKQLKFVFNQKQCTAVTHPDPDAKKPLFLKVLMKVWAEYPEYNDSNTCLIDDTAEKHRENPPTTQFAPRTWTHENRSDIRTEPMWADIMFPSTKT